MTVKRAESSAETRAESFAKAYPIRVAARRTGLEQHVIRAWERRYGAVRPARSEGRHRLYSDDQIRRLQLLRRATEEGHSIGRIARLTDGELMNLASSPIGVRCRSGPSVGGALSEVDACLRAIVDLDARGLRHTIEEAGERLGRDRLVEDVLAPLMGAVGAEAQDGALRPMHEHLASSVSLAVAASLCSDVPASRGAPEIIVTTPRHQHHELGAAFAAGLAAVEGWRVTLLGANLPAEEIAAAARSRPSRAAALGVTHPSDDPGLPDELLCLRRLIGPGISILVGGAAAPAYAETIDAIGGRLVSDFAHLRRVLRDLRRKPERRRIA